MDKIVLVFDLVLIMFDSELICCVCSFIFIFTKFVSLRRQAEDVMGSLLKEYLNLTQQQDELPKGSQTNGEETTMDEEKDNSVDKTTNPEDSNTGLKNGADVTGCLKNEGENLENQLQTSKSEPTARQQFKNVVAIVDPPRVGLHPTVSTNFSLSYVFKIDLCAMLYLEIFNTLCF